MRKTLLAALLMFATAPAFAQVIQVKTIPVAEGSVGAINPSGVEVAGGADIAVIDSLGGVYTNPALAVLTPPSVTIAPRFFGIGPDLAMEDGTMWTLPVHAMHRGGSWGGGMSFVLQTADIGNLMSAPDWRFRIPTTWPGDHTVDEWLPQRARTHTKNAFVGGTLAREIPGSNWSIGIGGHHGILNWADGAHLLYGTPAYMEQRGRTTELRIGAARQSDSGRFFDVVTAYHDYRMTHDIYSWGSWWWQTQLNHRIENDNTYGVGIKVRRHEPLSEQWTAGFKLAANVKHHAKIPDYDLMRIPRDPGDTQAFQLGVGFTRQHDGRRFAVDLVFEPIWSHTWADTPVAMGTPGGEIIPAGGITVENDFLLYNVHLRMGMSSTRGHALHQYGMNMRRIAYRLDQTNHIQAQERRQFESWVEADVSGGSTFRVLGADLGYSLHMTIGTGSPYVGGDGFQFLRSTGSLADFPIAPAGDLKLDHLFIFSARTFLRVPF
jgi:hypothetical protein